MPAMDSTSRTQMAVRRCHTAVCRVETQAMGLPVHLRPRLLHWLCDRIPQPYRIEAILFVRLNAHMDGASRIRQVCEAVPGGKELFASGPEAELNRCLLLGRWPRPRWDWPWSWRLRARWHGRLGTGHLHHWFSRKRLWQHHEPVLEVDLILG